MHAQNFLFLIFGISFYGILALWKMSKNSNKRPIEDVDESSNDEDDSLTKTDTDSDDALPRNILFYDSKEKNDESQVDVEFCAYDPVDSDFHGIKTLLQQLWLKEKVSCSDLADLIINDTISTVLKQPNNTIKKSMQDGSADDDDNTFVVMAIIPFNVHFMERESVKQIKELILSYLPEDHAISKKMNDPTQKLAFVINERFVNLPPKISVPCYKLLLTELDNHKKSHSYSDKPEDIFNKFEFEYIIMLSKLSKYNTEIMYSNGEDEIFCERSDSFYEYSVSDQADKVSMDWENEKKLFEPYRQIIMIEKAKWIRTINILEDVV